MTSRFPTLLVVATAATLVALFAFPAAAGELAIEGQVGSFSMTASDSASVVFGSSSGVTFGGALRYTFWRGAFASAGARTFSKDGERVFVQTPTSPVQKLGFPLSVRITPIFLTVGYRFLEGRMIVPYVGIGGSITQYEEKSEVAGDSRNQSFSKAGFHGAGGVEVGRGMLRFAAEASYSTVSGAVGLGGVTKVYGEDNLGGFTIVGKLILAFKIGGK
jgi:hypothetical protein